MNETSNPMGAGANEFTHGLTSFEAPIPTDASPALQALLTRGVESFEELSSVLTEARLGAAGGLLRALRLKHPASANHCMRVAIGCSMFARKLNLDAQTCEQIEIAALLHDIGKLAVPDQILNKPDQLNAAEHAVMERHLPLAIHIIEPLCDDQMILDIIRFAGNWFDGSHPVDSPVHGHSLPIGSRILAIQNAYDAMTSDRVYREAFTPQQAMAELLRHVPSQFDPELVAQFVELQSNEDTAYHTEIVRTWVNASSELADSVWTLAAPITQTSDDPRSIFQQRLLESMHDGVVFFDLSGRVIIWNQGATELTGLSRETIHFKMWKPKVVDMRDIEGNATKTHSCPVRNCMQSGEETTQRMTITNRRTGSRATVDLHLMPVRDARGTCHGVIMIIHDSSSECSLEMTVQSLHTKATRDALTGVNNRAEFDRRLEEEISIHKANCEPLSLVICDIDHFKSINDTYGHQAGDDALVGFAELISTASRDNDIVARYGGEEFVLICPGCDVDSAVKKADAIRRKLSTTRQPALSNTVMTASFGVTQLRNRDTPELMLKRADKGLYEAKETGRNKVCSDGDSAPSVTETWSWFGRKEKIVREQPLVESCLRSSVPLEVLTEKIRGFIDDAEGEVISADARKITISIDERAFQEPRRLNDRPIAFLMEIKLRDDEERGLGTLIDVEILQKRSRERRVDDMTERAHLLLKNFKSYLMADDV